MSTDAIALSPRHERFVLEYLKDANATQAYIRAGYSPRGAQPSASKLLRDPRIAAAIAAGRQHLSEALQVDVTRLTQEYAKIAFANVADYVTTDDQGCLRVDLEKASLAQQAGLLELRINNHRNPEKQQVTLKLGKLQALAMLTRNIGVLVPKPVPGPTAEDMQRYKEHCAGLEQALDHRDQEKRRLEAELQEARAALAAALAPQEQPAVCEEPQPPAEPAAESPPEQATAQPQAAVMPGMPTEPMPDHRPGLYPNAKFIWSGGRDHYLGPDSADALKTMKSGGFPGW